MHFILLSGNTAVDLGALAVGALLGTWFQWWLARDKVSVVLASVEIVVPAGTDHHITILDNIVQLTDDMHIVEKLDEESTLSKINAVFRVCKAYIPEADESYQQAQQIRSQMKKVLVADELIEHARNALEDKRLQEAMVISVAYRSKRVSAPAPKEQPSWIATLKETKKNDKDEYFYEIDFGDGDSVALRSIRLKENIMTARLKPLVDAFCHLDQTVIGELIDLGMIELNEERNRAVTVHDHLESLVEQHKLWKVSATVWNGGDRSALIVPVAELLIYHEKGVRANISLTCSTGEPEKELMKRMMLEKPEDTALEEEIAAKGHFVIEPQKGRPLEFLSGVPTKSLENAYSDGFLVCQLMLKRADVAHGLKAALTQKLKLWSPLLRSNRARFGAKIAEQERDSLKELLGIRGDSVGN